MKKTQPSKTLQLFLQNKKENWISFSSFSITQQKIMIYLLSEIQKKLNFSKPKDLNLTLNYKFRSKDFKFNVGNRPEVAIKQLFTPNSNDIFNFKIYQLNKNEKNEFKYVFFPIFKLAEIIAKPKNNYIDNWEIKLALNDYFLELLDFSESNFTIFDFKNLSKIKNKNTLTFFWYFSQIKKKQDEQQFTHSIKKTTFLKKNNVSLKKHFKRFSDFKNRNLLPALEEINKLTNFKISLVGEEDNVLNFQIYKKPYFSEWDRLPLQEDKNRDKSEPPENPRRKQTRQEIDKLFN